MTTSSPLKTSCYTSESRMERVIPRDGVFKQIFLRSTTAVDKKQCNSMLLGNCDIYSTLSIYQSTPSLHCEYASMPSSWVRLSRHNIFLLQLQFGTTYHDCIKSTRPSMRINSTMPSHVYQSMDFAATSIVLPMTQNTLNETATFL